MGGLAGGIVFLLLGWLIYGKLLMGFITDHPGLAGNVGRAEPELLYLIIGNLAMGFLFAYIFVKSGVTTLAGGLVTGGIVGLLMGIGVDSITYATTTVTSKTAMAADVAGLIVMTAIGGAIIAMVIGMGTKTSA